ncbi:MAG: Rab family GTPase [Candidatus Improbicoccus pseudotrichonymphae]|uniref:Rab family GTPase n=1 Tax=Candidatus Improbicoccus pseudotrichonymphae TaxID=3033792 RepID=A0AA48IH01_9FIRM|nr:MAG: Rab family GTPase [Candidatus Improbicoccus pseudotrichonymphae]
MKKESNGVGENKNSKKINKNNKIISSILAVVMCCQSFVGAGPPLNTDNTVDIVESSISKNENENENGLKGSEDDNENSNVKEDGSDNNKKSKGILEKIKDNCFELAVGGLGLVVLCAAGFALWFRKLNDKNPHNVEEPKVNPSKIVDPSKIEIAAYHNLKVVLVGDSGVGKTCFYNRLLNNKFKENTEPTFSVNFENKRQANNEDQEFELRIFDTVGREDFRNVLGIYISNAEVICVCFDLNKKNGGYTVGDGTIVGYLSSWVKTGKDRSPNARFMFIGCKSDFEQEANGDDEIENAISSLELGNKVIKDSNNNDRSFFKTSAKSGNGVKEVLNAISSNVTVEE